MNSFEEIYKIIYNPDERIEKKLDKYIRTCASIDEVYNYRILLRRTIGNNSIDIFMKKINKYLASGGDIDAVGSYNETLLHRAVGSNRIDIVKHLVELGANMNICEDEDGGTPLSIALNHGYYDIATYLVDSGADVNIASIGGCTPLLTAAINRDEDKIIPYLEYLMDRGANGKHIYKGLTVYQTLEKWGYPKNAQFIESYVPIPTKGVHLSDCD